MLTEEMRTLELRTAGRCVCAVQAFCRRRNLGGGRIHFRRAFESPKGFAGHWPAKPKKKDTTKVVSFFLSYVDKKDAWDQGFFGDISGVQLSLFSRFAF